MVQSVAGQLTASFASCLQSQLAPPAEAEQPVAATPPRPAGAVPVSGLRLGVKALVDVITKPFRRRR